MIPSTQTNMDFSQLPDKLNLGCGFDKRPDYLNVDLSEMHNPDLVADVLNLGFLPKNHYAEIIAQDILEHLPRTSTKRALLHWAHLLKPKGVLKLRIPNILGVAKMLTSPLNQSLARQEAIVQNLFGTQAYTGDFHFTSFTKVTITAYLEQCGFSIAEFSEMDEWLFDIAAIKEKSVNPRDVDDFSDLLNGLTDSRQFVQTCYQEILGRAVDDGGLAFYSGELDAHRIGKEQLIAILVQSDERQQRRAAQAR